MAPLNIDQKDKLGSDHVEDADDLKQGNDMILSTFRKLNLCRMNWKGEKVES